MRLTHPVILLLLALGIFVATLRFNVRSGIAIPKRQRRSAPNITATDTKGIPFRLSDYKGKVVLLNFWKTSCALCELEQPLLKELASDSAGKELEVIGVAMGSDEVNAVPAYLQRHPVTYRLVYGNQTIAQQFGGLDSFPVDFFIDKDGGVAAGMRYTNATSSSPKQSFVAVISELLRESQSRAPR